MRIWRLTDPVYGLGLDGEGARLFGGRWNNPGKPLVYCAATLSLAVLEALVHLPPVMRRHGAFPARIAVELDLPDAACQPGPALGTEAETRAAGDLWLTEHRSLALEVPSHVIQVETNILISPAHPDAAQLRLVRQFPFVFDDRLGA